MAKENCVILIYQEYESLNLLFKSILTSKGYSDVYSIDKLSHFKVMQHTYEPDLILFEVDFERQYEALNELLADPMYASIKEKVICVIGYGNNHMQLSVNALGLHYVLTKPFDINNLLMIVERRLETNVMDLCTFYG
ncbi:hypothetical protein BTR22_14340 [Alkalihalophilus pseudofirmus]|uniref:response regulator n=1 Tax=Alkalihalophilus pseudofirmus TaxID=79885 RepID=UPI00095367ED|nr:hypothetical protein BTR22_14340 [Alkalihalophilus pseudofirmus]